MGLTLTTVVDGTPITASGVQAYVEKIERYLNEDISALDLDSDPWVDSVHIFKPEFYGSPNPRAKFVSGATHHFRKTDSLYTAAAFHYELGRESAVHVPGLQATLKIPQNSTRVNVTASFAAYEWGGDSPIHEGGELSLTPVFVAATFHLYQDEAKISSSGRRLYTASSNDPAALADDELAVLGALVARKQICMSHSFSFDAGVHTCGVRVVATAAPTTGTNVDWKHIFVLQRNFVVDYHLR